MEASNSLVWFNFAYQGKQYKLTMRDLTNQRLIQMKEWFGPRYGTFLSPMDLIRSGDSQMWACAVWIGQQKYGDPVQDPRTMDFSFDDFEVIEDDPVEEATQVPTEGHTVPPTSDSAATASSDSEPSTSSDSPTSASSPPPKSTRSRSSTSSS